MSRKFTHALLNPHRWDFDIYGAIELLKKWPGWFFSATWETVNPFDKSVFTSFANSGIFGKWFDKSAFSGIANDGIFAKWIEIG